MISHLLQQAGIQSRVLGEYLQGAVGELPAAGLVRVTVDDAVEQEAREVIRAWELARPAVSPALDSAQTAVSPSRRWGSTLGSGVLGLLIGAMLTWLALRTPGSESEMDFDADGVIDQRDVYAGAARLRSELDRNADGRVDATFGYRDGLTVLAREDADFDGRFETEYDYARELPVQSRTDVEGNGSVDIRCRFSAGVLVRCEYLAAGERVVKVEEFRAGRLFATARDSDGDGTLNVRVAFDAMGEPVSESQ